MRTRIPSSESWAHGAAQTYGAEENPASRFRFNYQNHTGFGTPLKTTNPAKRWSLPKKGKSKLTIHKHFGARLGCFWEQQMCVLGSVVSEAFEAFFNWLVIVSMTKNLSSKFKRKTFVMHSPKTIFDSKCLTLVFTPLNSSALLAHGLPVCAALHLLDTVGSPCRCTGDCWPHSRHSLDHRFWS